MGSEEENNIGDVELRKILENSEDVEDIEKVLY